MKYFIIDTDIGGDIDDVLTLILAKDVFDMKENVLLGITTGHFQVELKSKISSVILKELNMENIPIYSGEGVNFDKEDSNSKFLEENPHWPVGFGVPIPNEEKREKKILKDQGKAYKCFKHFDDVSYKPGAVDFLIKSSEKAIKETKFPLNIISIGPPINIAKSLIKCPSISKSIAITLMGGWFEDENHLPVRLGYNTGLNPKWSQIIFDSGCKTRIVSSQLIKDLNICINEDEYHSLETHKNLNKLGECVFQDWKNWNQQDTFHTKNIADPLTLYLGIYSDLITEEKTYQINLTKFEGKKISFLDKKCSELIEIIEKHSNVSVITRIKSPEFIRKDIIERITKMLTENLH